MRPRQQLRAFFEGCEIRGSNADNENCKEREREREMKEKKREKKDVEAFVCRVGGG